MRGEEGRAHAGWRRGSCGFCNRFVQNSARRLGNALQEAFPQEAARLRVQIEEKLYAESLEAFAKMYPRRPAKRAVRRPGLRVLP